MALIPVDMGQPDVTQERKKPANQRKSASMLAFVRMLVEAAGIAYPLQKIIENQLISVLLLLPVEWVCVAEFVAHRVPQESFHCKNLRGHLEIHR